MTQSLSYSVATVVVAYLGLSTSAAAQSVSALFAENCAVCHGGDLSGGSAPTMLDDRWYTDGSDLALFEAITDGIPDMGMQPFGETLSEAERWALVVYIREKHAQFNRPPDAAPDANGVYTSDHHDFTLETLAEGLERPWSIAFLPDGRALITERPGRLRIIEDGVLLDEPVAGLPDVWEHGQGGLMEAVPHPDYESNGWIYLAYSHRHPDGRNEGMTRIVRGRLDGNRWTDEELIYEAPLATYRSSGVHWGSRIVFDDEGHLFFPIGDRGAGPQAQELNRPNGKVHRINDDGTIPRDNPFVSRPGALPTIWSYGHRNPQGLAFHPETGELWDTEHGPRGGDELNRVQKGHNYGWDNVSYGIHYNGRPFRQPVHGEDYTAPVHVWTPSIAVCGIEFYTGDGFPQWENDLFVTGLRGQRVERFRIEDGAVTEREILMLGLGRMRDAATAPDGSLWLALENPGRIVRLVPVE